MAVKYYRPKRKFDLVRHLEVEHPSNNRIEPHHWTVAALHELHDGLHKERTVR